MKFLLLGIVILFSITLYYNGVRTVFDPLNKCELTQHTFYSQADKDFFIKANIYKLKNTQSDKAILLLPPTGGENILDIGYAYSFCRKGFNVFSLTHWTQERGSTDYALDLDVHQRYMTRTQQAIKLSLKNINEKTVGVLGTSSGAIDFSVALGDPEVSKRVSAFYNIVGGAPLCNIIARAGESALSEVRQKRFNEFNFKNEAEYIDKICSKVSWKIPKSKPENISFAMVLASKDSTVPYDLQVTLKDWWQPKEVEIHPNGHFLTILKTYFMQKKQIIEFFKTNLN